MTNNTPEWVTRVLDEADRLADRQAAAAADLVAQTSTQPADTLRARLAQLERDLDQSITFLFVSVAWGLALAILAMGVTHA